MRDVMKRGGSPWVMGIATSQEMPVWMMAASAVLLALCLAWALIRMRRRRRKRRAVRPVRPSEETARPVMSQPSAEATCPVMARPSAKAARPVMPQPSAEAAQAVGEPLRILEDIVFCESEEIIP